MMRFALALVASVAGTAVSAQTGYVENCYSNIIKVEAVDFSKAVIEDREVRARVSYVDQDGVPLKSIELGFEIWSDARPLPLYKSVIRNLRNIDGGMLAGETLEASDYHFMEEREKTMAKETHELELRFKVIAVKDLGGNRIPCGW